jgi:F0F1-type ATP synthase delta subunit
MEEKIAAKLFLFNNQFDIKLLVLKIVKEIQGQDIEKVIDIYTKMSKGEILVAHIKTSIELNVENQDKIRQYIQNKYTKKNIVFYYETDVNTHNGIEVTIGDDTMSFNL